jgi:hypothetical protein
MGLKNSGAVAVAVTMILGACCPVTAAVTTITETLSATFAPAGKLSVPSSVTLTHTGTVFNPFTASLTLNYRARTLTGGNITLQITTNFAAGGPSVTAGDLKYTCSGATLGTNCSGSITASASTATGVLTLPANSCTGASCGNADPNSMTIGFTLADSPTTKTGSYSATAKFIISST